MACNTTYTIKPSKRDNVRAVSRQTITQGGTNLATTPHTVTEGSNLPGKTHPTIAETPHTLAEGRNLLADYVDTLHTLAEERNILAKTHNAQPV